jgi:hypothetical protein
MDTQLKPLFWAFDEAAAATEVHHSGRSVKTPLK